VVSILALRGLRTLRLLRCVADVVCVVLDEGRATAPECARQVSRPEIDEEQRGASRVVVEHDDVEQRC